MPDASTFRNNAAANRYELETRQGVAIAKYEERDGALAFTHTEVPQAMKGRGVASQLIGQALADVRRQGLKVIPLCEFVAAYIERHPEEQDLLARHAPG